ncbi:TPA: hypothetical protein ACPSKE_001506 [Legionella feeleii]
MPVLLVKGHKEVLEPLPKSPAISLGAAQKFFLKGAAAASYIVKKPRYRTLIGIFRDSFPSELSRYKEWTYLDFESQQPNMTILDKTKLEPYVRHLKDLAVEAAFGEVVYMKILRALFPNSMEVPDNYLHIDPVTGEPWIISRLIPDFNEFIEKKLTLFLGSSMKSAAEWDERAKPKRAHLNFSNNELYLLGKLYCTALITHDWDVVNNIMLSNSGCLGDSLTAKKVVVVDGGNKFHFGFGGLTCAESANENPQFNSDAKPIPAHRGFNFTLPFDIEVFLTLPRQIVGDLFTPDNEFFMLGVTDMLREAKASLEANPSCIQEAVNLAYEQISEDSDKTTKERLTNRESTLLNHNYYRGGRRSGYILEKILIGRINSLDNLLKRLSEGHSVETLNQETLECYQSAQRFS